MSASQRKDPGSVPNLAGEKDNVYFNLPFPIPAYLVSLAVGDLQSAKIGPRSHVWTEPCVLVGVTIMSKCAFFEKTDDSRLFLQKRHTLTLL